MAGVATKSQSPVCPTCDYLLTGLVSRVCPECGTTLDADLSRYLPAQRPTPWSARRPRPMLIRGLPAVIFRPIRALAICDDPARVTTARALVFAAACTAVPVLAWPVIREVVIALSLAIFFKPSRGADFLQYVATTDWVSSRFWTHLWLWEAWSVLRWITFFGGLALISVAASGERRRQIPAYLKRLLLFAPWVAVLEFCLLATNLIAYHDVIPEPSSLIPLPYDGRWIVWGILRAWLLRSAAPLLLVGFLFCRGVLRWGNRWSIAGAVGVTLLGIPLSPIWSGHYIAITP